MLLVEGANNLASYLCSMIPKIVVVQFSAEQTFVTTSLLGETCQLICYSRVGYTVRGECAAEAR